LHEVETSLDVLSVLTCLHFVSEIQDVFHQLAQLTVDQVLLSKTKQKYGL